MFDLNNNVDSREITNSACEADVRNATKSESRELLCLIASNLNILRDQKESLSDFYYTDIGRIHGDEALADLEAQLESIKKVSKAAKAVLQKKNAIKKMAFVTEKTVQELFQLHVNMQSVMVDSQAFLDRLNLAKNTINIFHFKFLQQFKDSSISTQEKKELCEKIAADPGSQDPSALFFASLHFLKAKEFERAACLWIGAIFRAEIDIRLSHDVSLDGFGFLSTIFLTDVMQTTQLRPEEQELLISALEKAQHNFEAWDRATPRNYNPIWWIGGSSGSFTTQMSEEKKRAVIEKLYFELKVLDFFNLPLN